MNEELERIYAQQTPRVEYHEHGFGYWTCPAVTIDLKVVKTKTGELVDGQIIRLTPEQFCQMLVDAPRDIPGFSKVVGELAAEFASPKTHSFLVNNRLVTGTIEGESD